MKSDKDRDDKSSTGLSSAATEYIDDLGVNIV